MAKPLWKQCVDYLEKLNVIPSNHSILNSENIVDLVNLLKDGVILCLLINAVDKCSINLNEVCMKPQKSSFLCLKNVQLFLSSCSTYFGLENEDLFKPDELFECTNFIKVINTITRLSHSPKAIIKGYNPLPVLENNLNHNEDLYKNLEKLSFKEENNEEEDPLSIYKTYETNENKDKNIKSVEDTIYEDLCYIAVKLQSELPKCSLIPNNNREHCLKELLDTERNYIDALNMIVKHFMRPLKSVMRYEDHSTIFFEIKLLLELHNGFYTDLYNSIENCNLNEVCISKAFFNWSSFFIIYGDYVANLEKAQFLIGDLTKKSIFLQEKIDYYQKQANDGKFQLSDLIALPMQRILKYHLLLKEIVKQTPDTHIDYQSIVKAYKIMVDLGEYLNEAKRDSEMLDTIAAIQNSITDLIMPENTVLHDYGRLIKDGEIKVRSFDDNKIKTRYVFLFDKVIVMCKAIKSTQYSFKEAFALGDYQVQDGSTMNSKFSKDAKSHIFYLVDCSKNHTYTFYAKTEELKNRWVQAIKKALDNICPQYNSNRLMDHTFVMKSFEKGSYCDHCEKWFKGLYYQGYKCIVCRVSVHKNCIPLVKSCGPPCLPPKSSPQILNFKKQISSDKSFKTKFENQRLIRHSIENYDWFANSMDRQTAEKILIRLSNGAFLVRISSKQQGIYAISLKDGQTVKHMRILETEDNRFYLSHSKYFNNLVDLVNWYSVHSLADSFIGLTICLKLPYKKCLNLGLVDNNFKLTDENISKPIIGYAKALYKFTGEHPALSFQKDDIIEILDKSGERKGWWKGSLKGKIGYIPFNYVKEFENNQFKKLIKQNFDFYQTIKQIKLAIHLQNIGQKKKNKFEMITSFSFDDIYNIHYIYLHKIT